MPAYISLDRVIRGPGIYLRRDGGAAEVVYCRGGRWYGHLLGPQLIASLACQWRSSGSAMIYGHGESAHDLICRADRDPPLGMAGGEYAEPLFETVV